MIHDIFTGIGGGFGRSLFADDGALWKRGRNVDYVLWLAQVALDSAVAWSDKWGFRFSASKSNYMIFGSKRKLPERGLTIYGAPLERVKVFQFLGVWPGRCSCAVGPSGPLQSLRFWWRWVSCPYR